MLTLRCTQKLLRHLGAKPDAAPPGSSTRLGDWYGNVLEGPGSHLLLFVSERSLLPVLVPAHGSGTVHARLCVAAGQVLRALGIPEETVAVELAAMAEATVARTANRRVLGSMNDFAWLLDGYLVPGGSPLEVALHLAEAPCSPLGMLSPERVTRELFAAVPAG